MIPRMFGESEVAAALPFAGLIDHMAREMGQQVEAPLRMAIGDRGGREFLIMPALSDRFAGVKMLSIVPDNGTRSRPVNGGLFMLFDSINGAALATMDATELTARRTAAVSALASRRLARADAAHLLVLGTGHIAPYLAEAHAHVRSLTSVTIWGRDRERAEACADIVRARLSGISVACADDLETAVRAADIISAATRAQSPLIRGAWLQEGTHLDLVGGYRPDMREIDDAGILRASIYVDTREGTVAEAGDLRSPLDRGVIAETAILGDIAALLAGAGRTSAREVTLFKSVGSAVADLVAAQRVWEVAGG